MYGIYALVNLFSPNSLARCTRSFVLRKQINACVNTIRQHFPLRNLHVRGEVLANKNNTTSLWKIINRCILSKERKIQCYGKDSEQIANEFNKFLSLLEKKLQTLQLK